MCRFHGPVTQEREDAGPGVEVSAEAHGKLRRWRGLGEEEDAHSHDLTANVEGSDRLRLGPSPPPPPGGNLIRPRFTRESQFQNTGPSECIQADSNACGHRRRCLARCAAMLHTSPVERCCVARKVIMRCGSWLRMNSGWITSESPDNKSNHGVCVCVGVWRAGRGLTSAAASVRSAHLLLAGP